MSKLTEEENRDWIWSCWAELTLTLEHTTGRILDFGGTLEEEKEEPQLEG